MYKLLIILTIALPALVNANTIGDLIGVNQRGATALDRIAHAVGTHHGTEMHDEWREPRRLTGDSEQKREQFEKALSAEVIEMEQKLSKAEVEYKDYLRHVHDLGINGELSGERNKHRNNEVTVEVKKIEAGIKKLTQEVALVNSFAEALKATYAKNPSSFEFQPRIKIGALSDTASKIPSLTLTVLERFAEANTANGLGSQIVESLQYLKDTGISKNVTIIQDIANTSFLELIDSIQASNRDSARFISNYIAKAVEVGENVKSKEFLLKGASALHVDFIERTPWAPSDQKVEFDKLSAENKAKDIDPFKRGLSLFLGTIDALSSVEKSSSAASKSISNSLGNNLESIKKAVKGLKIKR